MTKGKIRLVASEYERASGDVCEAPVKSKENQ